MKRLAAQTLLVLFAVIAAAQQEAVKPFARVMNRLVEAFNAGEYAVVGQDFNAGMNAALPPDKSEPFFRQMAAQVGKIKKVHPPRITPPAQAIFRLECERATLDAKLVLDGEHKIAGLLFSSAAADLPVPEKHETGLALPFKGRWLVFWGGDTREQNQHHDVTNQSFAFDLLGVGPDGKTRRGASDKNEDYYAFGREILAPADGIVADVIEGVRDNVPGSMNPFSALGNAVFIQHREYEVSVLAHFKRGSIRVKAGDVVKKGQLLGLCGNSGNSSEPHLHYHLQNTPIIQDATGIKCYFDKMKVSKEVKTESKSNYSPVKGEIIEPE